MTPRRVFFRPSFLLLLALAATHVPACEYGTYSDPNNEPQVQTALLTLPATAVPMPSLYAPGLYVSGLPQA